MVKIVQHLGIFEATEERDHRPTAAELYYWYSGTHAGLDPNNPYAPKRQSVVKVVYKKVTRGTYG